MSQDAVAVALVHDVVLERSASAIYVARRDDRTLFVAGPDFTDAPPSCFRDVLISAVLELDHSLADVAALSVGSCAFRQDRSDPCTHGTIPNGPTFLVTYEVRPNESNLEAAELGGAFVNCWIVADTLESHPFLLSALLFVPIAPFETRRAFRERLIEDWLAFRANSTQSKRAFEAPAAGPDRRLNDGRSSSFGQRAL